MLQNIPIELQELDRWLLAKPDKSPWIVQTDGTLRAVGPHGPYMTFKDACAWGKYLDLNIGFALTAHDPFTCIDLDVKDTENCSDPSKWTSREHFDLYWRIVQSFQSYTETSVGGKGFHIWVRGKASRNVKRDGVEVYAHSRYMICTGKVVLDVPIQERQSMIDNMLSQMSVAPEPSLEDLPDSTEEDGDGYILRRASEAKNSDKFLTLFAGDWSGYPSQSEADAALIGILCFWSKSNAQVRRLFRMSGLGRREKAQRDDYLNRTIAVFRRQEAEQKRFDLATQNFLSTLGREAQPLHVPNQTTPEQIPSPVAAVLAAPVTIQEQPDASSLQWPPGFVGRLAQFMYQSNQRPIKEVAITAALGLMAGICGRRWHIPRSGLNLYLILVAQSGIGKDGLMSGISTVLKACAMKDPNFHQFVDYTEYVSGQALVKACADRSSFVNIYEEFGQKLERIALGNEPGMSTLRTQMTRLYQRSDPTSILGGLGYSDKSNNVQSINGFAYSLIGDSTPGKFYDSLTPSMMEDGFLSRFLVIEYNGQRPPLSESILMQPDAPLVEAVCRLAWFAQSDQSQLVGRTEEASRIMREYEYLCDAEINASQDESYRQMWNRAALKMLRISALLAVGDNPVTPVVEAHHVMWARDIVNRNIHLLKGRLEEGIGVTDYNRYKKVISYIRAWFATEQEKFGEAFYRMQKANIVPRKYLQSRAVNVAAFSGARQGANLALDGTVASLCADGTLIEVPKDHLVKNYRFHGKAFFVPDLSTLGNE